MASRTDQREGFLLSTGVHRSPPGAPAQRTAQTMSRPGRSVGQEIVLPAKMTAAKALSGKRRIGPSGFLESRTPPRVWSRANSTQLLLSPLRLDLRQPSSTQLPPPV